MNKYRIFYVFVLKISEKTLKKRYTELRVIVDFNKNVILSGIFTFFY